MTRQISRRVLEVIMCPGRPRGNLRYVGLEGISCVD